jgi:hypothetical protein
MILSVACLLVIIVSVVVLYSFNPIGESSNPEKLDISTQVMVGSDGCTVTRTDLQGTSSVINLQ